MLNTFFNITLLLVITVLSICDAQLFHSAPIAYTLQRERQPRILQQLAPITIHDPSELAHPAVVENSIREAALPLELQRSNRFYSDPKVAAALAKDSWLTDKESPVIDREAEKIPREQVFKIFKNAGFIQRRRK